MVGIDIYHKNFREGRGIVTSGFISLHQHAVFQALTTDGVSDGSKNAS